jgi:hypothetical protein
MRRIDLKNKRFGRLLVIEFKATINGIAYWHCLCDCGKKRDVPSQRLREEKTQSCGCLHDEIRVSLKLKHGGRYWPEYRVWRAMIDRCEREKCEMYLYYGGRGISVCKRWHDFSNFIADLGRRPTPKHQLERDDRNGNYEPSNCRWATSLEQNRNRSNTVRVEIDGQIKTLGEWAESAGLKFGTISSRYYTGVRGAKLLAPKKVA